MPFLSPLHSFAQRVMPNTLAQCQLVKGTNEKLLEPYEVPQLEAAEQEMKVTSADPKAYSPMQQKGVPPGAE